MEQSIRGVKTCISGSIFAVQHLLINCNIILCICETCPLHRQEFSSMWLWMCLTLVLIFIFYYSTHSYSHCHMANRKKCLYKTLHISWKYWKGHTVCPRGQSDRQYMSCCFYCYIIRLWFHATKSAKSVQLYTFCTH